MLIVNPDSIGTNIKAIRHMKEFDDEIEKYKKLESARQRNLDAIEVYKADIVRIEQAQKDVGEGLKLFVLGQDSKSIKGAFGAVKTTTTSKIVFGMEPSDMVEWARENGYYEKLVNRQEREAFTEAPIKAEFDAIWKDAHDIAEGEEVEEQFIKLNGSLEKNTTVKVQF